MTHFTEGLARVFTSAARALKPGAPLAFTYHHNRLDAYKSIGVAILDSGLICSTTLPCPAEMGGSIHIHGTGSSIIDTVFVCRKTGAVRRKLLFDTRAQLMAILQSEIAELNKAGIKPTSGDLRCIVYGHVTRMAVWNLRNRWDAEADVEEKLKRFSDELDRFGEHQTIADALAENTQPALQPSLGYIPATLDTLDASSL